MRVVFDTNIYVAAFVFPGGQAAMAFDRILEGDDILIISKEILAELLTTLAKKFSRDAEALSQVAVILTELAEVVAPRRRLKVLSDEPDNRVLECAEAGSADCIVTGDKAMLKLSIYEHVRILSLRQYLGLQQ